jgi:heme-degrading monooxygenase HmoA
MVKMVELDKNVTLFDQMNCEAGPVVLINTFNVNAAQADELLEAWSLDATFFKAQPGVISTQLHRGIGGSAVFLNYAVWESVAHFKRAFSQPEFRSALERYPSSTVASPHLFQKVAVPGICVT